MSADRHTRPELDQGGRFFHLTGNNDKGRATEVLLRCYRRQEQGQDRPEEIETIGIGDSLNDLPLLLTVDHPVLVQRPDGSYDPDINLPNLIRAPGIGPAGWNQIVLELIRQTTREASRERASNIRVT